MFFLQIKLLDILAAPSESPDQILTWLYIRFRGNLKISDSCL